MLLQLTPGKLSLQNSWSYIHHHAQSQGSFRSISDKSVKIHIGYAHCGLLYTGQTVMGDDYQLYFLEDQQNKPVAVVLRKDATQEQTPALPEVCLA